MGSFLLVLLFVGIYVGLGILTVRHEMPKMDRYASRWHNRGTNGYHEKLNREVARAFCIWPLIWITGVVGMVLGPPWRKVRGFMFEPSDRMIQMKKEARESANFWGAERKRLINEKASEEEIQQAEKFYHDSMNRYNHL